MKLPRVSTRSILALLAIVAADCMVYRSFATRHQIVTPYNLALDTLSLITMANLLAVVIAMMVRDGVRARPARLGFIVGGLIGLGVTFVGFDPALHALGSALESTRFGNWLSATMIRQVLTLVVIVVVIPFLFQAVLGLAGGWIVGKFVPPLPAETPVSRRPWLLPSLSLVILLALPTLAVEGAFRWTIEPLLTRRTAGQEAVVAIRWSNGTPRVLPAGSKLNGLDGMKVRIERDDEASVIELENLGGTTALRDYRPVYGTLLDGNRAGETVGLPYCFLKPVP